MSTKKASAANGGKNQILERDKGNLAIFSASLQDNIYLTAAAGNGKLAFPNQVRHGKRLVNIPSIDAKIVNHTAIQFPAYNNGRIVHIGNSSRPGNGDIPVAHLARERDALPFFVPKSQPSEVSNV